MRNDIAKRLFMTFIFGGCFGLVSQLFVTVFAAVLGPDSPWVMAAMLALLGFIGAILYVFGIYQKMEQAGSMGAVLPFSGLVSAVASAFMGGYEESGFYAGIREGIKFFFYVLGIGSLLAAAIGIVIALV